MRSAFVNGFLLSTLLGLNATALLAQVSPYGAQILQQSGTQLLQQTPPCPGGPPCPPAEGASPESLRLDTPGDPSRLPATPSIPTASDLMRIGVPTVRSLQTVPSSSAAPLIPGVPALIIPRLPQKPPSPLLPGAPSGPAAKPAQMHRPGLDPAFATDVQITEYQEFVAQSVGRYLPLFGYNLFVGVPSTFAPVDNIPVTAEYVVGPGDEVLVRAWGQVDIELRAVVDRNGVINLPRVGNINVAGIRYQDLNAYLRTAIGRVYRNFELSATLGQLRSIQVFVVGQARRPGSYTVSSLSTLVSALFAAGGPSPNGSMRKIQLKRGDKAVAEFDLYDLLLKGDKSKDAPLLPGDVIHIAPVSQVAAIFGSVNEPAIYELKGKTRLKDVIELAGGLTTTADGRRATVERIEERKLRVVDEFNLDSAGMERELKDGDLVRIHTLSPKFDNAITLRGAVANPGRYPWRQGMRVRDIIPDKDALIVPDYWARQTRAPDVLVAGQQRLRVEVRRTYDEIHWDYAVIERLDYRDLTTALIPFNLGRAILGGDTASDPLLQPGDVITIFSRADIQVPIAKQTKYVRMEGEVAAPGVYQIMAGETLRQLLTRTGGVTPNAYLFGSEFTREAVREFQQRRLNEAIDFLEAEIQRNAALAGGSAAPGEAESIRLRTEGQQKLVDRMRQIRASGRIVLELGSDQVTINDLPSLALEDGDRFLVPSRPSTVSVIGSVYNQNAFLHRAGNRVSDYLARAGGPTRNADIDSTFVIRADGTVVSRRASGFIAIGGFDGDRMTPGDTIVVPEDLERFRLTKELKDWAQIFSQFALGVASLRVLKGL